MRKKGEEQRGRKAGPGGEGGSSGAGGGNGGSEEEFGAWFASSLAAPLG